MDITLTNIEFKLSAISDDEVKWRLGYCRMLPIVRLFFPPFYKVFTIVFFFRISLRAWISLFNTEPWISESLQDSIKNIPCYLVLGVEKNVWNDFFTHSEIISKLFSRKYFAKHRWIKCGFLFALSVIIPKLCALPYAHKLLPNCLHLLSLVVR